jgi:GNAT superfamily N-acetyltransferase
VITIRHGRVEDAALLAPMLESAIRATYPSIAPPAVFEAVIAHTCTPEAIAAAIESANASELGHFLVAEPVPLGFIDFGEDGDGLELRRLYTAVGETGRGVGTLLLAALEEALPTGTEYRAIVHKDNRRALTFWKRHGFTEVGLSTRATTSRPTAPWVSPTTRNRTIRCYCGASSAAEAQRSVVCPLATVA